MNEEEKKKTQILLIEKSLNPENLIYIENHFVDPETRFLELGEYLYECRFNVEIVPSTLNYLFNNFEMFKEKYNNQRTKKSCEPRSENFFNIFRKEPIHSMNDLVKYNFIFVHADHTEYLKLDKFSTDNPSISIIFPSGSLKCRSTINEFIAGVTRDTTNPQMYIIDDHERMIYNAVKLIEKLKK